MAALGGEKDRDEKRSGLLEAVAAAGFPRKRRLRLFPRVAGSVPAMRRVAGKSAAPPPSHHLVLTFPLFVGAIDGLSPALRS